MIRFAFATLLLVLSACDGATIAVGSTIAAAAPLAGSNTDYVRLTTQAALPAACASPYGCLYMKSSDSLPRLVDPSGNEYVAGTTWRARQYAGTPGSVATHDIWADTTTGFLMWRSSGGSVVIGNTGGWVTLDTNQTITGVKTFNGAPVFAAGLTASGSTANNFGGSTGDFTLSTGNVSWTGAASKSVTLTQGVATTGSPHAAKIVAGAHTTLTASTEANDVYFDLSRTTQWATGALATQRHFLVDAPTLAFVGASTVTNAATMAITGPPVAGTNATLTNTWALWIQSGYLNATGGLVTPTIGTSVAAQHALPSGTADLVANDSTKLPPAPSGAGKVLYDTGAAWAATAAGTTTQVLHGAAGSPTWGAVALASEVSGTLPAANGGTGATSLSSTYFDVVGSALVIKANVLVYAHHSAGGVAALGAATVYLGSPGQNASATELVMSLVTRASTSRNLYCYAGTAPGGADTVVITVRENASDQALTCTITGAGQSCSDTSNTFASVAGDRISVKAVSSAGTAAGLVCSWEETN